MAQLLVVITHLVGIIASANEERVCLPRDPNTESDGIANRVVELERRVTDLECQIPPRPRFVPTEEDERVGQAGPY